jgi:hypothetical protein
MFDHFSDINYNKWKQCDFLFQGTMHFCICVLLVITNFETLKVKVPPHESDIFRRTVNSNLYFVFSHVDGFQSF